MRIAISTGGGDAPGLNAVIRAAVLSAVNRGWDVLGIKRGYAGLLGEDEVVPLTRESVRGIAHLGGTILRTTNRGNPFFYPILRQDGTYEEIDRSGELLERARQLGIDAMISIGGDGSLAIAQKLVDKGMRIVCVPKTIDNDVSGTITTFGFDTAVNTAMEAIDKLHTTAESHDRVMVVEVMGRHAGWIATYSGLAGGADVILVPEEPFDIEEICDRLRHRHGRGASFSIVVIAEGAVPKEGTMELASGDLDEFGHVRLGGIGARLQDEIERRTGFEARMTSLGHVLRGGSPTAYDRVIATRFGIEAIDAVHEGDFGKMVALRGTDIVRAPIADGVQQLKTVDRELYADAAVFFG
jgi:6-phosphofructokinase 1